MSNRVHYNHCPVCGSAAIKPVLSAKDFTVSQEEFVIYECADCTLRFTQDVPDEVSISPYYRSDSYISHTNTSKGLINRLYQGVRKKTMNSKHRLIQESTSMQKGRLLDVGSGTGSFAHHMQQSGWEVTGLEPDNVARSKAKELFGLELDDIGQLYKLKPGSFDAITLWHVLEHVHQLHSYIQQLKTLLSDKGRLFIAVPNYDSTDAAIYGKYWAAYDVPRHLYHFSPKSMEILMEKNGFRMEKMKPMWYDSFYISLLSSKYKNGRANLPGAFINGLRSNIKTMGNTRKCSSIIYIISK